MRFRAPLLCSLLAVLPTLGLSLFVGRALAAPPNEAKAPAGMELQAVAAADEAAAAEAGVAAADAKPGQPDADDDTRFLRLTRENGALKALEVAIVHCVPKNGGQKAPTVDLVAAVHVAEPDYYAELNKRFAKYETVLYELVAPEGTRVVPGRGKGGSPVSMMQRGMTDMLELEFQLEGIDYQRENMVHADMSPEQMAKSMKRRGESLLQMFMRVLGYSLAKQGTSGGQDAKMLAAMFAQNRALALRRAMAEQFEDMDGMIQAIDGTEGSTLIGERNKKALEVLRKQMAGGGKQFAIFYGAAHMDDMLERLQNDFNLVPKKTEWLVAWKLSEDAPGDERETPEKAVPQRAGR